MTAPEELKQWWGPSGFTIPDVEVDLREGGRYRFTMQPPEGEAFHLTGEFREVVPVALLSYTFVWEEPAPDDQETLVTLRLEDTDGATELSLTQGEFATTERLELHRNGWSDGFEKIAALLSRR